MVLKDRRFTKMQNSRHNLIKTRVKHKKKSHGNGIETSELGAVQVLPIDVKRHLFACEQLLERQRWKGFFHCIVKIKRYSSYTPTSTYKSNIQSSKVKLCIWWDQLGVLHYEVQTPAVKITGNRCV